jgi:FAD/FMN-containing dehydrogenase
VNLPVGERLFGSFFDEVDGVVAVPARVSLAEIQRKVAPRGWRFPLVLDREAPLADQVSASAFAPASSRFGPYCDNLTGMNWELPDGRRVRMGERVVKSTTGYDLHRFLLGTGDRYGRPTDFVLRLRPLGDAGTVWSLRGKSASLEEVARKLLHSSYLPWLESFDWIGDRQSAEPWLRLAVHSPKEELEMFGGWVQDMARPEGIHVEATLGDGSVSDGLPDAVVKTSPDHVFSLARQLTRGTGVRWVGLCACAAIHLYLPPELRDPTQIQALLEPLQERLWEEGGDWSSRHVSSTVVLAEEASWLAVLRKEWGLAA